MKSVLRKFAKSLGSILGPSEDTETEVKRSLVDYKSCKVNLGQMQASMNSQKSITDFSEVEFQVFSQFGDDGIIQWLVSQLPFQNKTFIEFGVENYREANTRFLLTNNYWSGLVMDGSPANIQALQSERLYIFFDLVGLDAFITVENINQLIASSGFGKPVDILSVDIDGNDYWVWQAIDSIDPILVICEYNSLFGFDHPFTIKYRSNFVRGDQYPFSYYGTSLLSANDLASSRGYTFIGCNSAGNNAYFLKTSWLEHLPKAPCSLSEGYRFSSFTESRTPDGTPIRGIDRIRALDGLPVIDTRTQLERRLDANEIIESLQKHSKVVRF